MSVSSIKPITFECLNTLSNFCNVSVLYFEMAVVISDFKVSAVLVVAFSSYLTYEVNIIEVVYGSTISGTTEATLYFFNCVIIDCFVVSVKVEPEAALIAILTTP